MTLAASLRSALAAGLARNVDIMPGERRDPMLDEDQAILPAAVLMAVTDQPEPSVILTVRQAHLRKHSGQVAFPGGRVDPDDDGPVAAALREAQEEIGLPPSIVDVIGTADRFTTITGYDITPVLGVVPPGLNLVPHEHEVATIFEVPLAHLLDPANHLARSVEWQGRMRDYYEIPWDGQRIWGVTAALIVNISRRLALAA